jgi:hypothetical protein
MANLKLARASISGLTGAFSDCRHECDPLRPIRGHCGCFHTVIIILRARQALPSAGIWPTSNWLELQLAACRRRFLAADSNSCCSVRLELTATLLIPFKTSGECDRRCREREYGQPQIGESARQRLVGSVYYSRTRIPAAASDLNQSPLLKYSQYRNLKIKDATDCGNMPNLKLMRTSIGSLTGAFTTADSKSSCCIRSNLIAAFCKIS